MKVVTSIAKMQELSRQTRGAGLCVGFVPTMGFLHEGHLELVRKAKALADVVVVSIFVNPTQFDRRDDFDTYPRDEKTDRALLEREGVDILFEPSAEEVYPEGADTCVNVPRLTHNLCGAHRPGHFDGVATVVSALFNMVRPDLAVFGEKDYQQLQLVRRMTRDLHFPVAIVPGPTVREADGLAMSSRNARLEPGHREQAPIINAALRAAAAAFLEGETGAARLLGIVREKLDSCKAIKLEYLELIDGESLEPVEVADQDSVIAVAAFMGAVRLIDNIIFARATAERRGNGRLDELERQGGDHDATISN